MGQKVSLPSCVTGENPKVRVKTPCGRREEVYTPCAASKVMGKHPEHLVVHCSLVNGEAVDITIIAPNQPLLPGVPYMLYPKVESAGSTGSEESNIPSSLSLSVNDRKVTFRSTSSLHSPSKKSNWQSLNSLSRKGASPELAQKPECSPERG